MFLNMITFLLTTYIYYKSFVPKLSYEILSDPSKYQSYVAKGYVSLAIYFLAILIVQFCINTYAISSNCGGLLSDNLTASLLLTFLPWGLIFGAVVIVLTIFPGFKGAFSNVIGYYYVSKRANELLTNLLLNQKLEKALNKNIEPSAPPLPLDSKEYVGGSKNEKQRLEAAADAIVKICGNTSILINQIVPSNFVKYWNVLDPLMKPQYRNNSVEGVGIREELLKLTVTRDRFGEAFWFLYTGVLIVSVVQMKIATRGCESNLQAMEQNYQQYQQEEQSKLAAKANIKETEYTITN